jgi:antitoxin HicB
LPIDRLTPEKWPLQRITNGQPVKFEQIGVPLYLAPKLALYLAMRERHMTNTELAERLGISETVIRRMLNPKHDTRPEKIQAALVALGKRVIVTFEDAA